VFLEQRIRRIARWPQTRRPARAFVFALVALALLATALSARDPLRRSPLLPSTTASAERDLVLASDTPPMTKRPELRNVAEVQEAVRAGYPPLLRDAGIGGAPTVWLHVDERGSVGRMQISRSSGFPALDQAALNVAAIMQFSPGENERGPVGVWIELPIEFGTNLRVPQPERARVPAPPGTPDPVPSPERARVPAPPGTPEPAPSPARAPAPVRTPVPPRDLADTLTEMRRRRETEIRAAPTFTPFTVRPEFSNVAEMQRELVRLYPPLLRDAGIGGTAYVWLFVNERGEVERVQLSRPTGYPALDEAALQVAAMALFTPARNRDRVVPVWIEVPIAFTAR
jgi:TonB family protein